MVYGCLGSISLMLSPKVVAIGQNATRSKPNLKVMGEGGLNKPYTKYLDPLILNSDPAYLDFPGLLTLSPQPQRRSYTSFDHHNFLSF